MIIIDMNTEQQPTSPTQESLAVVLPSDVKTRPTHEDMKQLIKRMKSYDEILEKQAKIDQLKQETLREKLKRSLRLLLRGKGIRKFTVRTDSAPLPEEYGDVSQLIALDINKLNLNQLSFANQVDGERIGPVSEMFSEVEKQSGQDFNIGRVPPIFLKIEKPKENSVDQNGRLFVRDGNHRFTVAIKRKLPYLLAYVLTDDLAKFKELGIPYREVTGKPQS